MDVIAWNCQGAGADLTKEHLEELHKRFHPRFLFLSETKNKRSIMQDVQVSFGYDQVFTVEPRGRSGGLALFFMNDPTVVISYFDEHMIDVETKCEGYKVFLTFVYGDPVVKNRGNVWERLTRMSITRKNAWFMIGDFNEITGNHEKRGGSRRSESSFIPFRTMLENCGMIDFPYKGNSLSWTGRRRSGKVKCRLDRAIGNEEWHSFFSHTNVEYLKFWGSDHRPVLACIRTIDRKSKKSFRFDKRWIGKPGLNEAIVSGWGTFGGIPFRDFQQKLSSCRSNISRWKKTLPTNTAILIKELKDKIDCAQASDDTTFEEMEDLRRRLCTAFREKEIFWKQKSRILWHQKGDRNTKFFHATTKLRRARNRITSLKDKNGVWVEDSIGIERVATNYFHELFTSSCPSDLVDPLRYITEKVSDATNRSLVVDPSMEEIRLALFEINPDKAPDPDGMTSRFYQKFWQVVGQDITKLVKDFFETGRFDPRLNQTNICLIPKKDRPRAMT